MIVFLAVKDGKPKILAYFDTHREADVWWLRVRPDAKRVELEAPNKQDDNE